MRLLITRWRIVRLLLAFVLSSSLVATYIHLKSRPSYTLYHELERTELRYSQKWVKETPEGWRYVKFRQLRGAGFNNQAQEILLFHHLALQSSRTYVYQPLVWRPRGEHSLVPLSAFLRSPTRDGAISLAIFDEVCPAYATEHVSLGDGASSDLWRYAMNTLDAHPAKCVVVDDWILNWNYLASSAIHAIWPSFKDYLARSFRWSDSVVEITRRAQLRLSLRSNPARNDGNPYMAIHFRRGDFEEHCHSLAGSRVGFTTWATLPLFTHSVFPPALDSSNETSTMEHCYPEISRFVKVIDTYARARPHLRYVHVLHDGTWDHPLVTFQRYRLETALKTSGQDWPGGPMKGLTHSGMLPMHLGEADFAVAVDVELARNAEVFIGNGFSSLSSQVLALRLGADGGKVEDITIL